MIIIAARPAMGKSTLALDVARSGAIHHDQTTVFFSLEMGRAEIAMRLLSAEATIPLQKLRKGELDQRDFQKLAATQARINEAPLFIDDSPNLTLVEGFPIVPVDLLADGIHPGDEGHAAMAAAIGPVVAGALTG